MKVRELMMRDVQTCRSHEPIQAAAHKMWDADIGAVAIVDDKNRLAGMLTDRDICMAAYTQGRSLDTIIAAEVMSGKVFSVQPDDTIARAEELMTKHQIRRLPVIDKERHLVGIITLSDLARAAAASHRGERELLGTLAAVSAPRRPVPPTA